MTWIIDRENFTGNAQTSTHTDAQGIRRAAYTDQTAEEYLESNPTFEEVADEEFFRMVDNYQLSLCTPWKRCTEAHFWEMLEVLPPSRWTRHQGVEIFHVCERLTGNLVNWFMSKNGRFYTRVQFADQDLDLLVQGAK